MKVSHYSAFITPEHIILKTLELLRNISISGESVSLFTPLNSLFLVSF